MADSHDQSMERHGDCRGTKDRFKIPIDDQALGGAPFVALPFVALDEPQRAYLIDRRQALGDDFPQ